MKELVIIPLGTISPYCKGKMNCPGFLIEYGNNKILLDCGNGITSLLDFPNCLNNLNVFVTHYHKDHYGDLGALQYASFVYKGLGILKEPINIYLPSNDINYSKKEIIENKESFSNYYDISDNITYGIEDINVSFYNNNSHTIESFVTKLENEYFKIVYTSDIGTTNFEELSKFCYKADILICESSLLKKHHSNSKTHLTAYDASMLAKIAQIKNLVLTHFWPEEDKNLYVEEAKQNFDNVIAAYEGKRIRLVK